MEPTGRPRRTAEAAFNQLQTYVTELPMAFRFAAFVVATDGINARYGTPFTPWNHFASWNVDDDGHPVAMGEPGPDGEHHTETDWTLNGLFNLERFSQLFHDFIAFDEDASGLTKRISKPHQYFAVTKAVGSTIEAVRSDGRIGVVWHTQGSGKSMEMELYTAKVMGHPRLANPTIVVLTDRTELDTQLFDGFQRSTLLPEQPRQIGSREELRTQLSERRTGGIYFTTLQKFGLLPGRTRGGAAHPLLSDRAASSSSRTRPTAATTATSTATPAISAAPCRTPRPSPSPAPPSGKRTATPRGVRRRHRRVRPAPGCGRQRHRACLLRTPAHPAAFAISTTTRSTTPPRRRPLA